MKSPRQAWLVLLLGGCIAVANCGRRHDSTAFTPSSPEFSGALTLSASLESIPADGFSRVQITAQITGQAELDKRMVRFTTDNGDFPREAAGTKTTDAEVNSNGVVSVDLRSSTAVAIATITAQVLERDGNNETPINGLVTRITVEFAAPDRDDIIRLSTSQPAGEADGESVLFVHADISPGVPLTNRAVVFTTTAGSFVANDTQTVTVTADIGLRASAGLKSPDTLGEALITAKVMDTTTELRLPFGLALPDAIVLEITGPKTLTRGGDEETTVEATLSRANGRGKVTPGTAVSYAAFEKAYGEPLDLAFRNQTPSDASEKSTATVSLGGVAFVGTATLRAEVSGVRGEADLEIDSPADEPDISVAPPNLDFGDVSIAGSGADLPLTITNNGKETLFVSKLEITGGEFTVIGPPPLPAEIGEGVMVPLIVRFSPTHLGPQDGVLLITSNDPQEGVLAVSLSGEGI